MKKTIIENLKTIFYALVIAIIIRSLLYQPFYIPSSSMEPNLLVGDRLFVSKFAYGYSRHSFPFSPKLFNNRIFENEPKRGDVIVFKTPSDNRTDYIKRLIGLPGDTLQFIDGDLYLNNSIISKEEVQEFDQINCGDEKIKANFFREKMPNGKSYIVAYRKNGSMVNSDIYTVPEYHYFFMGDNRDCSRDSRFLGSVGYVNFNNFVGKAKIVFFSNDKEMGGFLKFWRWNHSIRTDRLFERIN